MNRMVICACCMMLLAGHVASGNDLVQLDAERIYEIAKSEIVARHLDLAKAQLSEGEIAYSYRPVTTAGFESGRISVTLGVSGSESTNRNSATFGLSGSITNDYSVLWEVLTVTMNAKGKVFPLTHPVRRKFERKGVRKASRLEPREHSGGPFTLRWKDAPLLHALALYADLTQKAIVVDPSVPSFLVSAETEQLTGAEMLELIERILKENMVSLENKKDGTIRAFCSQAEQVMEDGRCMRFPKTGTHELSRSRGLVPEVGVRES